MAGLTEEEIWMGKKGTQPTERRSVARKNAYVPISINWACNSSAISGRIQDISFGGMRVNAEITSMPCQKNDEVTVSVNQPYFKFQGKGKILWTSQTGNTVGIQFTQLNQEAKNSLNEFLSLFIHVPPQ